MASPWQKVGIVHGRMDANPIVLDETAGDVVVVVVEGEHDIYTAPTLRERLDEALGRGGGIVVDLTAATERLVKALAERRRGVDVVLAFHDHDDDVAGGLVEHDGVGVHTAVHDSRSDRR